MSDLEITGYTQSLIREHLTVLYSPRAGDLYFEKVHQRLSRFLERNLDLPRIHTNSNDGPVVSPVERPVVSPVERLTEADVILITYGDQIHEPDSAPLKSLAEFLDAHLKGIISGVHILPFFPYSSDDGFSVIDYRQVDPELGTWEDVNRIAQVFRLMIDLVINHISRESAWFQAFLDSNPRYSDYFITVDPNTDLSMVVRPRSSPLLTPVETAHGTQHVWTTFSEDQIDLNFANPEVLLDMIDVLLLYVENGAEFIRLDAIAYLWKKIGTPSIHLEETHRIVQLFRAVLDLVAPNVLLITETNVPHEENVSYFGDGTNEAQMVYQFSLAPLVVNAIHTGNARHLLAWAEGLETPSETTTFFNFTASHDGIGVRPAEGILDAGELKQLVDLAKAHGGFVSYKTNPDGTESPYELNISLFDALSDPGKVQEEGLEVQIQRFMVSQAIMLSLAGVPGIYVHSLLGSRSYLEGVRRTGRYRSINREKFHRKALEAALADSNSLRHKVFQRYVRLLRARTGHAAFHPNGAQRILFDNDALFSLLRTSPDRTEQVLCLHNVSVRSQPFQADLRALQISHGDSVQDIITGTHYPIDRGSTLALTVTPYEVLWLKI